MTTRPCGLFAKIRDRDVQLSSSYLVYVFEVSDVEPNVDKPCLFNRGYVEHDFAQWVISADSIVVVDLDAEVVVRGLGAREREFLVPSWRQGLFDDLRFLYVGGGRNSRVELKLTVRIGRPAYNACFQVSRLDKIDYYLIDAS